MNRRSPLAGATSDRPAAIFAVSAAKPAERRTTRSGRAASRAAAFSPDGPGTHRRRPLTPLSVSSMSMAEPAGRGAPPLVLSLGHGYFAAASASAFSLASSSTSEGTSISRLRILPVGPLGSSSRNHTWRGYL